jgi:hypothetical protein
VLDGAGWHASPRLRAPNGIRLCFLPPYTPELQPAEHLWPLADETVANRPFASLDQLADALDRRCSTLTDDPAIIKANTNFHWWPVGYQNHLSRDLIGHIIGLGPMPATLAPHDQAHLGGERLALRHRRRFALASFAPHNPGMTPDLTDDDKPILAALLREVIAADRFLLSPRVRSFKAILAKLEPPPALPEPLSRSRRAEHGPGEEAAAVTITGRGVGCSGEEREGRK